MNNKEIARELFQSFVVGDDDTARRLCSPDVQASQNNGPAMNLETLLAFSAGVKNVVSNFRYEDILCSATDTGFVEEHTVKAILPDGNELALSVCIVADIESGQIVRLREYFDSAQVAALAKVLV